MTTVNTQRVMSVVRQVLAYAAIVMGVVTAAVSGIHLPASVSAVLVAVGGVLVNVEHYVSDPSTGTPTPPTASTPPTPPTV